MYDFHLPDVFRHPRQLELGRVRAGGEVGDRRVPFTVCYTLSTLSQVQAAARATIHGVFEPQLCIGVKVLWELENREHFITTCLEFKFGEFLAGPASFTLSPTASVVTVDHAV